MSGENVTDEGVQYLAEHCPLLEDLSLASSTKVTDESIEDLAMKCLHMKKLNISRCFRLTNAAFEQIATKFENLQELVMYGVHTMREQHRAALKSKRVRISYRLPPPNAQRKQIMPVLGQRNPERYYDYSQMPLEDFVCPTHLEISALVRRDSIVDNFACHCSRVRCEYCKVMVPECAIHEHESVCRFFPKPCTLCNTLVAPAHLAAHYHSCKGYTVTCMICRDEVLRVDIADHYSQHTSTWSLSSPFCPQRVLGCQFGEELQVSQKSQKQTRATDHCQVCEYWTVVCPLCKENMSRDSVEEHFKTCQGRIRCMVGRLPAPQEENKTQETQCELKQKQEEKDSSVELKKEVTPKSKKSRRRSSEL